MSKVMSTAEDIAQNDFPAKGTPSEKLRFLLNYAVLAPSIYNSQPWLFNIAGGSVELYADRTRPMPVRDPQGRQLTMSCGAALFYLRIAARRFGYATHVDILPSPEKFDLLAQLDLGEEKAPSEEEEHLFEAFTKRRTNRELYEERALPAILVHELKDAAMIEGCQLSVLVEDEDKRSVAELVAEADRTLWADKRFRREMAGWIRSGMSVNYDGIEAEALGLGQFASYAVPDVIRSLDLGSERAVSDTEAIIGSPAVAVLATYEDTRTAWIWAGQALARVLLRAAWGDASASFLNQPIEVGHLRPRLRDITKSAAFPQTALRLGYGPEVPLTARRSVSSVLV